MRDYSGAALLPERITLHDRPRCSGDWQTVPLRPAGEELFQATLTRLAGGQELEYFFTAPTGVYAVTVQ